MIKETTCKELIRILALKKEFKKAEIFLPLIKSENTFRESMRSILDELLKVHYYDDAFALINKNLSGNELAYHLLLILNNQAKNSFQLNVELLSLAQGILKYLDNDRNTLKTHALLAEVLYRNGEPILAERQTDMALNLWEKESGEISELGPIITSLKAQDQTDKAKLFIRELGETIEENVTDDLARKNCLFELNQLVAILKDNSLFEDDGDPWLEEWELQKHIFHLEEVKSACYSFISKPIGLGVSEQQTFKRTIKKVLGIGQEDENIQLLLYYGQLDPEELRTELNTKRGQLKNMPVSAYSSQKSNRNDLLKNLSDYCNISTVYFEKKQFDLSENILRHALKIANEQVANYRESTLDFSAGPRKECLYIVCYHYLIRGDIHEANKLFQLMEDSYGSFDSRSRYDLFALCDSALNWIALREQYTSEILSFLYDKLSENLKSSISVRRINYLVRVLIASHSNVDKNKGINQLNELVDFISGMNMEKELKEACTIELLDGLLQLDGLNQVLKILDSVTFSEKGLSNMHEKIANYYFLKEPDIKKVFFQMKYLGKWLPKMKLENIIDAEHLEPLSPDMVLPIIHLFSEQPENLENLLQKYALNCLFYTKNYSEKGIAQLDRTLKLQWALDFKTQLTN
jgi:hypothetical protein